MLHVVVTEEYLKTGSVESLHQWPGQEGDPLQSNRSFYSTDNIDDLQR